MNLEIKKYPDPVLKKKAAPVGEITEGIRKLAQDLAETMAQKDGVGLACTQIGKSLRIIAVQTEEGPRVFINPQIIKKGREATVMEEGCLSVPGFFLKIKRAGEVEVAFLDLDGKELKVKAAGFLSHVFQHEIDHLDGVLIIDRVGFFKKLKIRKKLKSF